MYFPSPQNSQESPCAQRPFGQAVVAGISPYPPRHMPWCLPFIHTVSSEFPQVVEFFYRCFADSKSSRAVKRESQPPPERLPYTMYGCGHHSTMLVSMGSNHSAQQSTACSRGSTTSTSHISTPYATAHEIPARHGHTDRSGSSCVSPNPVLWIIWRTHYKLSGTP